MDEAEKNVVSQPDNLGKCYFICRCLFVADSWDNVDGGRDDIGNRDNQFDIAGSDTNRTQLVI